VKENQFRVQEVEDDENKSHPKDFIVFGTPVSLLGFLQ
jgi:hypothetical protein